MLRIARNRPGITSAAVLAACLVLCPSSVTFAFENIRFVQEISQGLSNPVDVAVDRDGEIYVLEEDPARIAVFDTEGRFLQSFKEAEDETARLRRPRSLAVSPRGRLVVADTGNDRVVVFNRGGPRLFEFGSRGRAPGQFQSPVALAVDHFGFIYVADRDNQRVQIFTPNGLYFDSFPLEHRPADIAVDAQRTVYVLTPDISRVVRYSPEGKKLDEIGCVWERKDHLRSGQAMTVDSRGDIYVSESAGQSVKKFDLEGKVLLSFGSSGEGRGQFLGVAGMTVDPQGQVFITDTENRRVQVFKITGSRKPDLVPVENSPLILDFDSTVAAETGLADIFSLPGKGLYMLGGESQRITVRGRNSARIGEGPQGNGLFLDARALAVTMAGRMFVADTGGDRVLILSPDGEEEYEFGQRGSQPGQFDAPRDIAVNGLGHIYVADTRNHRVQIFNHDGIYLNSLGHQKKNRAHPEAVLNSPTAIAVDSRDRVFVADDADQKVKVYDGRGRFVRAFGGAGEEYGRFRDITDLAFDENDRLYVAEQGNHRVQIFDPEGEWIMSFGSPGTGGGYFEEVAAVSASEGKVYVADRAVGYIQVFRYVGDDNEKGGRIYATRTAEPFADEDLNMVVRYGQACEQARQEAVKELAVNTGLDIPLIEENLRVESVSSLSNGEVKVTVSIPKEMLNRPVSDGEQGAEGKGDQQ